MDWTEMPETLESSSLAHAYREDASTHAYPEEASTYAYPSDATTHTYPEDATTPLSFCDLESVLIWEQVYHYTRVLECLVGFGANALTILAVVKFQYLNRKPHNILIVGLALADSLLGETLHSFRILVFL